MARFFCLCLVLLLLVLLISAFPSEQIGSLDDLILFHLGPTRHRDAAFSLAQDPWFLIQNANRACLSADDVSGTRVSVSTCGGLPSQLWQVEGPRNGAFRIRNRQTMEYLCLLESPRLTLGFCPFDATDPAAADSLLSWSLSSNRQIRIQDVCLSLHATRARERRQVLLGDCDSSAKAQWWALTSLPTDWESQVAEADLLFSALEPEDASLQASVGNGYLSTNVGSNAVYLSGLFNGLDSTSPSHRARIPSPLSITLPGLVPFASGLDVRQGMFYRRSYYDGAAGYLQVEQRWYANRDSPRSALVHELHVLVNQLGSNLVLQVSVNEGPISPDIDFQVDHETEEVIVRCGSTRIPEQLGGETLYVCTSATRVPSELVIPAGVNNTSFVHTLTVRSDLDSEDPKGDVTKDYNTAHDLANAGELRELHAQAWAQLWTSGIQIDISQDLDFAQAINSSFYYILSSVREDWPHSLSPGGLATNGYNGHTFWDCETWVYPILLSNFPALADSVLQYRLDRLEGARQKAASYDPPYRGVMFPWESASTGIETTPTWADTGRFEIHISGDIVFAVQQYYQQTGDSAWLIRYHELVLGVAEFWESRSVNVSTPDGYEYHIKGVIPPDEFAMGDNSVFTNVVAKMSLLFAVELAQKMGITHSYLETWKDIADHLKIPFDHARNIHLELDGATIKQADVVLLGYPLNYPMSPEIRMNDVKYYIERTDELGPAMTWGMYSIPYLEQKDPESAEPLFRRSYDNIQPPFGVWTETPVGGAVNFITGSGGFLQAITAGYAGWRLGADALTLDPQLMSRVSFVKIKQMHYKNAKIDVLFNATHISLEASYVGTQELCVFEESGRSHPLKALTLELGKLALRFCE